MKPSRGEGGRYDEITDKWIPEKPVSAAEAGGYGFAIAAGLAVALGAVWFSLKELVLEPAQNTVFAQAVRAAEIGRWLRITARGETSAEAPPLVPAVEAVPTPPAPPAPPIAASATDLMSSLLRAFDISEQVVEKCKREMIDPSTLVLMSEVRSLRVAFCLSLSHGSARSITG